MLSSNTKRRAVYHFCFKIERFLLKLFNVATVLPALLSDIYVTKCPLTMFLPLRHQGAALQIILIIIIFFSKVLSQGQK